jgi:hypothetical protein
MATTKYGLPEIPSEFIEPYLVKFMGNMIQYVAYARSEEDKKARNLGWTVADVKQWLKGVEVFVSEFCGIHSRYAMMHEVQRWQEMTDEQLKEMCDKVIEEVGVE